MDGNHDSGTRWPSPEEVCGKRASYAQNFEDVRLARALPGPQGFYLDVGANEPVFHSVTKLFYQRGWRGVNVEPLPAIWERLRVDRPRDVNLNAGVADRNGTLTFYERPDCPALSSFDPQLAGLGGYHVIERAVPVFTLAEVCDRHVGAGRTVDFLKVDAEGFEREILEGGDWGRWRPRVVIVEASPPDDCGPVLDGLGYLAAAFDGINRYYVREEDHALIPDLCAPVCVLDGAVPYEYLRLIEGYRAQMDLGPTVLELARRLRQLSRRFPKLTAAARRLLRDAG